MEYTDAELQTIWPELEAIARPARERRRLDPAVFARVVLALCTRSALSVRDLSILLKRSEAYVGDAIRPLVASGQLSFLYPDQPKHPRQKYLATSAETQTPTERVSPDIVVTPDTIITTDTVISPDTVIPPSNVQPAPKRAPRVPPQRRGSDPRTRTPAAIERVTPDSMVTRSSPDASVPHEHSSTPTRAPMRPPVPSTPTFVPPAVVGWGSPLVSVVASIVIGIVIAVAAKQHWLTYAAGASVALALAHVITRSRQFILYLQQTAERPHGTQPLDTPVFILIKSAFSFAEIAIVCWLFSLLAGSPS